MPRCGLLVVAVSFAAACSSPGGAGAADKLDEAEMREAIAIHSSAFAEGTAIPEMYSCDGDDLSPPLAWSGVPDDAAELALVVDDPDARRGTYVHWVVVGLSPDTTALEEGTLPSGARVARNSAGSPRYKGPCPPEGSTHHYRFTVYTLAQKSDVAEDTKTSDALDAIRGAALARGRLTATFRR